MTKEQPMEPMYFNLSQAAKWANVSRNTLRRHKQELIDHGAQINETVWKIPAKALIDSGIAARMSPPDNTKEEPILPGLDLEQLTELITLRERTKMKDEIIRQKDEQITQLKNQIDEMKKQNDAIKLIEAATTRKRHWWQREKKEEA
jgi:hypothetical protein